MFGYHDATNHLKSLVRESKYYGLLDDVLEVKYYGLGHCVVVVFKCTWFYTNGVVRVDPKHGLVDINISPG